jgi:Protein of unknown function (DUF3349)
MTEPAVPPRMLPLLDVLRRAYPHGVPEGDYLPLLEVLQFRMSERSLATLVAALTGAEPRSVAADSATLSGIDSSGPGMRATGRVRDHLEAHGWDTAIEGFAPEEWQGRISPLPDLPDYLLDSLAVLRRAYPDGIPAGDYLPLLATLTRDYSLRGLAQLVGAYTGRHYMSVYNDIGAIQEDAMRRDADRIWQLLLDNGWIPETPSDDWPSMRL